MKAGSASLSAFNGLVETVVELKRQINSFANANTQQAKSIQDQITALSQSQALMRIVEDLEASEPLTKPAFADCCKEQERKIQKLQQLYDTLNFDFSQWDKPAFSAEIQNEIIEKLTAEGAAFSQTGNSNQLQSEVPKDLSELPGRIALLEKQLKASGFHNAAKSGIRSFASRLTKKKYPC